MKKTNKKNTKKKINLTWIIVFLVILGGLSYISIYFPDLNWAYRIIAVGVGISAGHFIKKKNKTNNSADKEVGKKEEEKGQLSVYSIITKELGFMVDMSIMLVFLGFIYFGSIAPYFGVNDEFINPTNSSLGVNNSLKMVMEVGSGISYKVHSIGSSNPKFWFWFWWAGVFMTFVYPIVEGIYKIWKLKKNG